MAITETALFIAGLGAGLAGGYGLAARWPPGSTGDTTPGDRASDDDASDGETGDHAAATPVDGAADSHYRTVANNFPKGSVGLFDEDLRFRLATGGVFDYIDFDPTDFESHTIEDIFVESFVDRHREDYAAVFDGEESSFEMRHGDRFYRKHLVPVTDDDGAVVAGVEMTRDITALKAREQELRRQNERLEEFAGILSHDLRNPLNVALGRLELVDGEESEEHVEHIRDALARMQTLVDDVLTLARQGQSLDETEPVALGTAAADAWAHVDSPDATLENDLDATVEGDRGRVLQLFENLFRNAIDHGGSGVTVTAGTTENGFFVADDGAGIPEGERGQVFAHGHTTAEDGTGLGLAIVENVASAHGWTVSVTDSESGGARFEFDTTTSASETDPAECTS